MGEFLTKKQHQTAAEGQNSVGYVGLYMLNTTRFWLCWKTSQNRFQSWWGYSEWLKHRKC